MLHSSLHPFCSGNISKYSVEVLTLPISYTDGGAVYSETYLKTLPVGKFMSDRYLQVYAIQRGGLYCVVLH